MIKIVTDSTAYLPEATVREHDLRIVPLLVHFGEEEFKEVVELSHEAFYARLAAAPQLPTTSQPSPGDFVEAFRPLHDAGHEILCVTISSKLSGTFNSATAAKALLPEAKISVVDSLSTAVGLYLLVEAAAEAIRGGASLDQAVEHLELVKSKLHVLFVVDTLEYLAKGGRIGNAKAFLGTMLKIKPILFLDDGLIEPMEQVRSKRKAVVRLLDLTQEYAGDKGAEARVAVTHALAPEEAQQTSDELVARLRCRRPYVAELGPVIGTHTGPGVIGVGMYVL